MPLLPNELATKLSQEIKNNFTDRRHSNSEQLSRVSQAALASISSEITSVELSIRNTIIYSFIQNFKKQVILHLGYTITQGPDPGWK